MANASMSNLDFVNGFVACSRDGLTMKEIADALGMQYNACAARKKSLDKRYPGFEKFKAAEGKRGRKISAEDHAAIEALLSE